MNTKEILLNSMDRLAMYGPKKGKTVPELAVMLGRPESSMRKACAALLKSEQVIAIGKKPSVQYALPERASTEAAKDGKSKADGEVTKDDSAVKVYTKRERGELDENAPLDPAWADLFHSGSAVAIIIADLVKAAKPVPTDDLIAEVMAQHPTRIEAAVRITVTAYLSNLGITTIKRNGAPLPFTIIRDRKAHTAQIFARES